ncbi:hypothetical protein MNB_SM-6-973 [hydrothermal vent metagenome]|uniref:TonB-dependent receptor n=1 Tax=hydrothermal vent metagenome TaxID=652676 RepID=A0A1W1BG35_9ZZZZ
MKLFFLFIVIFSTLSSAYSIDQMLELYRKESDLSKKTKNESLGLLTIYTRDDIERMQAHNLGELLNSLRSFRYDENMFGLPDVFHADPSLYSSDVVKIFINNHEIASAYTGSGLFIYGNIDLGFVDHVEIYEGSTSSYINSEPSVITIKIYSKDPTREVGTNAQAYIGSRGMNHENISYASASEDINYYVYASHTKQNRTHYVHENHELSRDSKDNHVLMTLDYKNIKFGAEYINKEMDSFLSLSMFATPNQSSTNYTLKRASSIMNFLKDDSLQLALTFTRINENMNLNMDRTRWTTNPVKLLLPKDSLVFSTVDDVYNVKLEKKFKFAKNSFIAGSKYIKKSLHDTNTYNNGIKDQDPVWIDNSILSFYFQDDYKFAENQLLTAFAKQNIYHTKTSIVQDNFQTYQIRVGYIITSKENVFKFFASQMQIPTEQYALQMEDNPQVETLRIRDVSAEYSKNITQHTFGVCLEYIQNENPQSAIEKGILKYFDNYSGSVKYDYKFDPFNTLKSMVYINRYHNHTQKQLKRVNGAFVRLLNTWSKFDIYNEADYYHIQDSPVDGINYNLGIRYKATQSLIFSFKGTNIFKSAAKSRYSYVKMNGLHLEQKSLYISPIDQTFTVGMEYSF